MKVTALAGGVGGAKLLVGLDRVRSGTDLTAIVNIGDDAEIYGVHVSPDVDIVTYWLAGMVDDERGWGIEGDTFTWSKRSGDWATRTGSAWATETSPPASIGRSVWPKVGPLSAVTDEIRARLGCGHDLLPVSDDRRENPRSHRRWHATLPFQEYFVKEQNRARGDRGRATRAST